MRTRSYFVIWEQAAECACVRSPTTTDHDSLKEDFPALRQDDYFITGEKTPREAPNPYNCFGWGLCSRFYGVESQNPDDSVADQLAWFDGLYTRHGWKRSANCDPEKGKRKVALYCGGNGAPTHAAKQRGGDLWESKIGHNVRIIHSGTKALEGPKYGRVCRCYEKSLNDLVKEASDLIDKLDRLIGMGLNGHNQVAKREAESALKRLEADLANEGSQ
jgi:hypothetical protein